MFASGPDVNRAVIMIQAILLIILGVTTVAAIQDYFTYKIKNIYVYHISALALMQLGLEVSAYTIIGNFAAALLMLAVGALLYRYGIGAGDFKIVAALTLAFGYNMIVNAFIACSLFLLFRFIYAGKEKRVALGPAIAFAAVMLYLGFNFGDGFAQFIVSQFTTSI